jgi:t-SNARE complex subunit (syntaxin)
MVGVLVLIALLVQKELTAPSGDSRIHQLNRILNIGILPLMIAFIMIVVFKVLEALN